MILNKYEVDIYIDGDQWGTYEFLTVNMASAAFLAGCKFYAEEAKPFGVIMSVEVRPKQTW